MIRESAGRALRQLNNREHKLRRQLEHDPAVKALDVRMKKLRAERERVFEKAKNKLMGPLLAREKFINRTSERLMRQLAFCISKEDGQKAADDVQKFLRDLDNDIQDN